MVLSGNGAVPGFAVGRIYVHSKDFIVPSERYIQAGEEQSHLDRYFSVKKEALNELENIKISVQEENPQKAMIFDAHREIVDDVIINDEIPARILNDHWAGDWAIYQVYENVLVVLRQTANPLIAERAADFDDVRAKLLRLWHGKKNEGLAALKKPAIIAASELMPSDTANINREKVLAIVTEKGGIMSHTAIIAKSYGIPTVLGVQGLLENVKQGQLAAVNADEGKVFTDPEDDVVAEYNKKSSSFKKKRTETGTWLKKEAKTACGVKIDIGLNIANTDTDLSAEKYSDFVGLFRTEFLYMGRDTLPCEDEQFSVYRKVLERYGKRPVVLRTLDIGGDKRLSCFKMPQEENPFLGNRALRLCFSYPDIFKTQIRAALRASLYENLWLMFPMVTSIDDIRMAKEFIDISRDELKKKDFSCGEIKTGIMIEVPSIALIAGLAAEEVDFASIGSNDLCQYLCAADRMNSNVENYYQSYHPAMFCLIRDVVSSFIKADKPISICGELGCDEKAVPALIGLGLRKFSMGHGSVAAVKKTVASVTVKKCEEIAQQVLKLPDAAEIKNALEYARKVP
jgi:phosphotransferase system enzyme I (PtsI)